jgi:uncharacterized membrane protein
MMLMMGPFGGLGWLLVLGLIAAGVVALVLAVANRPPARPPEEDLLRMRYAQGEIDAEEYRSRLAALRSPAGGAP